MRTRDYACLKTHDDKAMMFEGVGATCDLRGLMLETTVEQRFRNSGERNVEVVYTFPLPWGAVLLGVDVLLGDVRLRGAVVEKNQAEARYEEALSEGDSAIMLEKNHDQSYCLNLGNLLAGEACVIALRYAETLEFFGPAEQRGLRLLIPTVIAPRHGDAVVDGGLSPHQAPATSVSVEYQFDITVRLHGDLARARVASTSHPIGASFADGVLTVSLAARAALDRDFVLVVDRLARDSLLVLAHDCVVPGHVVALASFCPRIAVDSSTAVAVKLLVDCSGSMAGDSIAAARRALQAIVSQLNRGDRFSLSRFGSSVEHRSRGWWSATDTTRLAARRWVGALDATLGGTEMEAALTSTFALAAAAKDRVDGDVLIVTDGEISAIDSTIATARASGHRVFVVGIGSSSAESHLRRLAEATGGACDFVAPGEAVEPAVLRMFARLRSPRLTEVTVAWPAGSEPVWVSPVSASLFDGDTLNCFALFDAMPVGKVRLFGTRSAGAMPEEIGCADFGAAVETGDSLSRVAACARLRSCQTGSAVGLALEARRLALAYQLVTQETNFLLIHQRAEHDNPTDMPDLHKIRQMLPAGWGGTGSVGSSRSAKDFESRSLDYAASGSLTWNAYDTPAVFRSTHDCFAKLDVAQTDLPPYPARDDGIVDRSNPRFWCESGDHAGLTPLGLCEWLRRTPMPEWPTSYEGLLEIGLPASVVVWLDLLPICPGAASHTEKDIVAAFLYLVSRREIDDATTARANFDAALTETLMIALETLTADRWPDQVCAAGAVGAVGEHESGRGIDCS